LPASGIVVTARFTDPAAQTDVLESARSGGQDLWSPAWKEGAGSVVGAITISRLFHGQPKGRSALEHEVGLYLPEDTPRDMAVKELGVVWVSRVAVDAPYRDRGIGEELLRILRASIGATLPWQPRLIEVMQSVTPAKLRESDNGFFTMAGYHRYEHATYTAPARMIGEDGLPRTDLTPLRTLYFWSRIEPPP
jgi:GNAT superfamily N-acetyltransferase